ncbi:unnamed protein product [Somion occarium]|uniref:Uncharacterized protein n=1 Tax=Somion occarium TaxID=3059160 RepID=A0ABP1D4Z9_9APHY
MSDDQIIQRIKAAKAHIEADFQKADNTFDTVLNSDKYPEDLKKYVKSLKSENDALKSSFKYDQIETAYDHSAWVSAVAGDFINKDYSELVRDETPLDDRKKIAENDIKRFEEGFKRFKWAREDFAPFPAKVTTYVDKVATLFKRYKLDALANEFVKLFSNIPDSFTAFDVVFFIAELNAEAAVVGLQTANKQNNNAAFKDEVKKVESNVRPFETFLKDFEEVLKPSQGQ